MYPSITSIVRSSFADYFTQVTTTALSVVLAIWSGHWVCGEEVGIVQPAWGTISSDKEHAGVYFVEVSQAFAEARLALPTPFPHLVQAEIVGQTNRAVTFDFNRDATELHIAADGPLDAKTRLRLVTSETTQQFPDGRIVFSAKDAQVVGTKAQLETHPGNHRIGFWTESTDAVQWNYSATRWGMYRVLLTYSTASPDGSEIELTIGTINAKTRLISTGSWYRYTTIDVGTHYLEKSGMLTLKVRCVKKVGGAVMNLKAIQLIPACEGTPPVQADDGIVTLHGRDSVVDATVMRYEPDPMKLTLGYWINVTDGAHWDMALKKPGMYDVEVWQGCGTGQGGSDMIVTVGGNELKFVVEDTGHFQNFKPRIIGRVELTSAGTHLVSVRPERIANKAACDIRQIRLLPVLP